MSRPSRSRRPALAFAAAAFAVIAPIGYVSARVYEVARMGPVNPVLIVSEVHTAFYFRAAVASFWGGLAAIIAYALGRTREKRSNRRPLPPRRFALLAVVAGAFAMTLGILSWLFP